MATSRLCLAVLSLYITLSTASPVSPSNLQNGSLLSPRGDSEKHPNWGCPFTGNSDLYGLGIRLGVYVQLFSTLLANAFLSRSLREDAHNTNAIIMIAIFAGMANATIRGQLNGVEIFVMSTLLTAFLWSEFTPRHISSIVLFDSAGTSRDGVNKKRLAREAREKKQKIGVNQAMIWGYSKMVADELSPTTNSRYPVPTEKKSYFAALARSVFGTAFAVFNLWYWFYGRHVYLKNGIENPVCQPTIFLHMQIELEGLQPLFYVILAVGYGLWEVTFMTWWVVVLAPGTARLVYNLVSIVVTSVFRLKFRRLERIRKTFAVWYLGFARLDERKLRVFEYLRMKPETQERIRRMKLYAYSAFFPLLSPFLFFANCVTVSSHGGVSPPGIA